MKPARKFVSFTVLVFFFFALQGCEKKKSAGLSSKIQAPTVAVVLPDEIPLAEEQEEPAQKNAEPPPPPAPTNTKPKRPSKTSSAAKKSNPAPANQNAPNTQVVASARPPRNPADSAPPTAIAAAIPNAQVAQQKEETTRMVDATENALKGLTRSLNDDEKAMKTQIQSYLQQSRKATTDGDFERAFNLAKKAQVLAEALSKK